MPPWVFDEILVTCFTRLESSGGASTGFVTITETCGTADMATGMGADGLATEGGTTGIV